MSDENCNLNVSNTIFLQNSGALGGAVYADHSFLLMLDCIFVGNTAFMKMNNWDPNKIKTGCRWSNTCVEFCNENLSIWILK